MWVGRRERDTAYAKVFDVDKLSAWFAFLVDNVYLTFTTDMVLRQRIGIPMGTNCAVFVRIFSVTRMNMISFCAWWQRASLICSDAFGLRGVLLMICCLAITQIFVAISM